MKKSMKVIISTLVIAITAVTVIIIADINKTRSRVEVIETPNYHIELAGAFDMGNFTIGDNNKSNEIFATSDGGWIASNHMGNGRSNLIKYKKNGVKEWETEVDTAIEVQHLEYIYPNEPSRSTVEERPKSNPYISDIRHITEALDGSGYFVQTNNYNVVTKYNTRGEKVWQSQNYDQMGLYTFEKVCEYAGNTDSNGNVRLYQWTSRTVNGVIEWYWRENYYADLSSHWLGGDKFEIDSKHYYCGVKEEYPNYRSSYSGYLAPDTEGGVFLIINTYESYPFKLSDGSIVRMPTAYTAHHYNAQGEYVGVYDISALITQGRQNYATNYNVTYAGDFSMNGDLYHSYVGTYPNGDILFASPNASDIVKIRFNKQANRFDLISYNTPGWNGTKYAGRYNNNWDGILDFTLLKNGGYSLIMNTSTSEGNLIGGSVDAYYNTPVQQFDLGRIYHDESGNEYRTPGSTTPIQIYKENGTYDNIIIPYGSKNKHNDIFDVYGDDNDWLYYSTGNGSGAGFILTDDGGAIAFLPIYSYSISRYYERDPKVTLLSGEEVEINPDASLIIVKYTSKSKIEWIKQYKGIERRGSANTKLRMSTDGRMFIAPYVVNDDATDLDTGESIVSKVGGTGPKFLMFNMGYDRQENIIPDPVVTNPTQPTSEPVITKTTKKKSKKTTTTTEAPTEPTTEETTTTSTTTTSKKTTTQKQEVKGEETKKKDPKMVIIIAISSLGGLFTVGIGFYFIPIIFFPKKKVLIGLSGNKDSAVAARLLLDKGYKVTALFIGNGSNLQQSTYAKQVCSKLNIDLYEQEIDETYRNKMAEGIMNNPTADLDTIYNKYILVDMLKQVAKEQHIKYISCGIYAKKESGAIVPGVNNVFDESSKLSLLTEEDIKKIVLPLGEIDYQQVEKIAEENYINLSNKKQTPEEKIGK